MPDFYYKTDDTIESRDIQPHSSRIPRAETGRSEDRRSSSSYNNYEADTEYAAEHSDRAGDMSPRCAAPELLLS
ncbi:hypothetical protein Trydic_g12522 [Trypoxylus dichotomus]